MLGDFGEVCTECIVFGVLTIMTPLNKTILAFCPPVIALSAVLLEPIVTPWVRGRESVLPMVICLLLSSLLHPRIRTMLVSILCYGVAFLAIRDVVHFRHQHLPPMLDYDFIEQIRPLGLIIAALLAMTAAVAETVRPGTVWARRCYFGAASLYFTGYGLVTYGWHGSWQSIVLMVTGIAAMVGCVFANRIVAFELEAEDDADMDDTVSQRELEESHARSLRMKEWHDSMMPSDPGMPAG